MEINAPKCINFSLRIQMNAACDEKRHIFHIKSVIERQRKKRMNLYAVSLHILLEY